VRSRRSSAFRRRAAVASLLLMLAAASSVAVSSLLGQRVTPLKISLLTVGLVAILQLMVIPRLVTRDWFHPLVFPIIYITVALFAPVCYILLSGKSIPTITPAELTSTVAEALALTVLGVSAGSLASLAIVRFHPFSPTQPSRAGPPPTAASPPFSYATLRSLGRFILTLSVVLRVFWLATVYGRPYGAGSVATATTAGLSGLVDSISVTAFFVGVILVVLANVEIRGVLGRRQEFLLAAAFTILTLLGGKRGVLIAPFLFVLWAYHTYIRQLRTWLLVITLVTVLLVFQGVAATRAGGAFFSGTSSATQQTLSSISSPLFTTIQVVAEVPTGHAYYDGATYLAALYRQLPSPLADSLFGPPNDTGAYVFRQLIGFQSPNAGYDFSIPAEGYLNFGLAGDLAAGLVIGILLGAAYRTRRSAPTRARHIFYPLLLCTLPLALRSDALGTIKSVLYPMLILAAVFAVARARPPSAHQRTRQPLYS